MQRPMTTAVLLGFSILIAACCPSPSSAWQPLPVGVGVARASIVVATASDACFEGDPVSALFDDIEVIENAGYTVGFSPETLTPICACYKFTKVDDPPELPRPKKSFNMHVSGDVAVRHKDYTNSGFDRGHLAPSSGVGKNFGRDAQLGTFKCSNICPQHPGLNQRCWERFEHQVANYYADKLEDIWVVTGPIYQDTCIELLSDVRVPQAFFKVVVAKIGGQVEMLGIIMPNERTEDSKISRYVHTVDEIEALAGLDLFHKLGNVVEDAAESKEDPHSKWNIGWELRPTFPGTERAIQIRECD